MCTFVVFYLCYLWELPSPKKQIISETDIAMRLHNFPVQWLAEVSWSRNPNNMDHIAHQLSVIADDLIFARDNSLGLHKPKLENAKLSQD